MTNFVIGHDMKSRIWPQLQKPDPKADIDTPNLADALQQYRHPDRWLADCPQRIEPRIGIVNQLCVSDNQSAWARAKAKAVIAGCQGKKRCGDWQLLGIAPSPPPPLRDHRYHA